MTRIESKKVNAKASAEKVFAFLSDMNNIEKLLPTGKYSDWKSDATSCSFKVQGGYTIALKYKSATPHSSIQYESGQGSPFPFVLHTHLNEKDGTTEAYMECEAQINPFLEMIVKGPLKNLFDYMAEKLEAQS